MKVYYSLLILLLPLGLWGSLSYDAAMYNAQKGDMKKADEQLQKIIVDCPDNAEVLYDAAVVAYNLKNFSQAAAYFNHAAVCAQDNKDLKVRSHFNAGNALVEMKDLQKALEHYNKALAIDPTNTYALNNRDRVAQMLEEQKNQPQQNNDKDNEDKNNTDKNKEDSSQDENQKNQQPDQNDQNSQQNQNNDIAEKQKNDGANQDENSANENKDSQQSSQDGENKLSQQDQQSSNDKENKSLKDQSQEQQGDSNRDNTKDNSESKQREQHRDKQKEKQDSQEKQQGNSKHNLQEKSENNNKKGDKKQINQHEKTPAEEKDADNQDNLTAQDTQDVVLDPLLMRILKEQEDRDKTINKQLMEAKIRQQGGKNGQNCW